MVMLAVVVRADVRGSLVVVVVVVVMAAAMGVVARAEDGPLT